MIARHRCTNIRSCISSHLRRPSHSFLLSKSETEHQSAAVPRSRNFWRRKCQAPGEASLAEPPNVVHASDLLHHCTHQLRCIRDFRLSVKLLEALDYGHVVAEHFHDPEQRNSSANSADINFPRLSSSTRSLKGRDEILLQQRRIRKRRVGTISDHVRRILTNIEYPRELLIYDAGDTRTTFIAFWKAVALLQCGTCIILITPLLYKNENQPNEYIRTAQAVGGRSNSALYSMSYVPSRYCHVACLPL